LIAAALDAIGKEHIGALISTGEPEKRQREYKESLPPKGDAKATIEFLDDVASLANAAGGDIMFGVVEERDSAGTHTGRIKSAPGLKLVTTQHDEELRLLQMVRDKIEPRPIIAPRWVEGFENGPIFILRITKSWNGPHRVRHNDASRFLTRAGIGKYHMDLNEIRTAFVLSSTLGELVRRFRAERLASIKADDTPMELTGTARTVLHLFPAQASDFSFRLDPRAVRLQQRYWFPLGYSGANPGYNSDGHITTLHTREGTSAYMQVFRNGPIEAVAAESFSSRRYSFQLSPTVLAREIITATRNYVALYKALEVSPPIFCMVTLLGFRGCIFPLDAPDHGSGYAPSILDRDTLSPADVAIEDYDMPIDRVLRPVFDMLWQSAGHEQCPHYDNEGAWIGPPPR
jgi:hypothetical protein